MEADDLQHRNSGRRARIVCYRCHEKKVRCDLQRPEATCSACLNADATCQFRPSGKGHHRRKAGREARQSHSRSTDSIRPDQPVAVTDQPASLLPSLTSNGENYIRALLGHQSKLHGTSNSIDEATAPLAQGSDGFTPRVIRSYLETYSEVCYTWSPIIDADELTVSTGFLLLDRSLASVASMVKPSLMPGLDSSRKHYERARQLFFAERHHSTLTLTKAALLLSCCNNSRLGSSTDSSFWWLGVAIRLAQDLRLYRQPRNRTTGHDVGLQRRVWWTLFARERIMALCQGRPCMIDENDCNLGPSRISDFPESRHREASTFIHWVDLCRIMGETNRHMSTARQTGRRVPTQEIAISLTTWLQSIPDDLQLPIQGEYTRSFVRDIHLLYLPYLTTIMLMYLNTTGQDVPVVSAAAVLAAGCTARIIGDVLLQGCLNALSEDAGWFIAIAITALMHVRPLDSVAAYAASEIRMLRSALENLGTIWSSAKILAAGLDKIMDDRQPATTTSGENMEETHNEDSRSSSTREAAALFTPSANSLEDLCAGDGVSWAQFFPFATTQTSPLLGALLTQCQDSHLGLWPAFDFSEHFDALWDEVLGGQMDLLEDVQRDDQMQG